MSSSTFMECLHLHDNRTNGVLQFSSNGTAIGLVRIQDTMSIPPPNSTQSLGSSIICRYFLNGNCRYGSMCRFSHAVPTDQPENRTPNINSVQIAAESATTHACENRERNSNNQQLNSNITNLSNWVDAPEFIPRYIAINHNSNNVNSENADAINQFQATSSTANPFLHQQHQQQISYAQIVSGNATDDRDNGTFFTSPTDVNYHHPVEYLKTTLCPYLNRIVVGDGVLYCPYGESCVYQHGDLCDMCGQYCLHPTDENQRKSHQTECMQSLEKDMEHSFAVARSKDKTCGICFEVITEKVHREHRFGILPNCNHIFCLQCIRKWRQAKNFDSTITRACPECRVSSNYVVPSLYWVDTKQEKDKLLTAYKAALGQQNCKYFSQGKGNCPFGNKCFYKHALPNGELVDLGVPQQRRRLDLNGDSDIYDQLLLWNFLEARENVSSDDDYISFISTSSGGPELF